MNGILLLLRRDLEMLAYIVKQILFVAVLFKSVNEVFKSRRKPSLNEGMGNFHDVLLQTYLFLKIFTSDFGLYYVTNFVC